MSRTLKVLSLMLLVVFVLACNAIDQRVNQVEDAAKTVEAIGTALPIETLQALPSVIPQETFEAIATEMPDFGNMLDPQGAPVAEWNGIPIMEQATAGQEFKDTNTYSFKVDATVKEAEDFYNTELPKLGWTSSFSMPGSDTLVVLVFEKDSSLVTITITDVNGSVVVSLTTS